MTTMVTIKSLDSGFWSEQRSCSTTKSNERFALGGFWDIYGNLPDSIKGEIFALDNTYKKIMQDEVLVNIWKSRWQKFADKLECPLCMLVMDFLFDLWGINPETELDTGDRYYSFIRENHFPNDIRFVISNHSDFFGQMGVSIKVYNTSMPVDSNSSSTEPYYCMFEGWVLNDSEQKQTVSISNSYFDSRNIENVFWNENLNLWRKCW